jgi:SAM-dependent methyltransferase
MNLIARERCPICSGAPRAIGVAPTLNRAMTAQLFACVDCGHWWHTPVPDQDELLALYRTHSPFVVTPNAQEHYREKLHEDDFLRYLDARLHGARDAAYLEIGAGGGQLVRDFRRRGLVAYGVEPAQWSPQEGIVETLADLPEGVRFGIIVLQDVLEHLFDPLEMLAGLQRYAEKGARLFCSVPCSDSGPARRYGARWSMVLPFGHLHYFSERSAREALRRCGWETLDARRARTVPLSRLALRLRLRETAYELVKGGKDQLYVSAREHA